MIRFRRGALDIRADPTGDSFLLVAPGGVYPVTLFPGHMHPSVPVNRSADPRRLDRGFVDHA